MMMRKFTFTEDRNGRTDFMLVYSAFRGVPGDKVTADERASLAAAQRVLEPISEPIGNAAEDADDFAVDMRMRKLKSEATIEVSQKLHEKILGWLDAAPLQAGLSMQLEDCRDRWTAAEKFDQEIPSSGPVGIAGAVRKRK